MLVLVPSASHIWVKVIPGGRVHCHWKEPSLATVQERLAADTTLSGPGGTGGSREGDCKNVMGSMGRGTETRYRIYHRMISLTREMLTAFFHTQATFDLLHVLEMRLATRNLGYILQLCITSGQ